MKSEHVITETQRQEAVQHAIQTIEGAHYTMSPRHRHWIMEVIMTGSITGESQSIMNASGWKSKWNRAVINANRRILGNTSNRGMLRIRERMIRLMMKSLSDQDLGEYTVWLNGELRKLKAYHEDSSFMDQWWSYWIRTAPTGALRSEMLTVTAQVSYGKSCEMNTWHWISCVERDWRQDQEDQTLDWELLKNYCREKKVSLDSNSGLLFLFKELIETRDRWGSWLERVDLKALEEDHYWRIWTLVLENLDEKAVDFWRFMWQEDRNEITGGKAARIENLIRARVWGQFKERWSEQDFKKWETSILKSWPLLLQEQYACEQEKKQLQEACNESNQKNSLKKQNQAKRI